MKNLILTLSFLISLLLFSCKKDDATQKTEVKQPVEIKDVEPTEAPVSNTNAGETPPKLNPPHGQPFHRCEIAVGAPLDGTQAQAVPNPTPKNEPKSFFKALQKEEAPQEIVGGEKPKLNPAHGQPFHVCEIAVGAPLP